jgi:hypothetical protein
MFYAALRLFCTHLVDSGLKQSILPLWGGDLTETGEAYHD